MSQAQFGGDLAYEVTTSLVTASIGHGQELQVLAPQYEFSEGEALHIALREHATLHTAAENYTSENGFQVPEGVDVSDGDVVSPSDLYSMWADEMDASYDDIVAQAKLGAQDNFDGITEGAVVRYTDPKDGETYTGAVKTITDSVVGDGVHIELSCEDGYKRYLRDSINGIQAGRPSTWRSGLVTDFEVIEGGIDPDDYDLTVEKQWESGSGEVHAIHANVAVTTPDGDIPLHIRNAVDIGFQVFRRDVPDDADYEDKMPPSEVATYVRNNSPIPTGMRM